MRPYPAYKDSGVEWLGAVPEGWEISTVGRLASKIGSGKTPNGGAEVYSDHGIAFIRSQNVYDDGLFLDDIVYISPEIDEEMAGTRVAPGDILLNITGASLGRTCLVPSSFPCANVNQHVCIVRAANSGMGPFLALALQSANSKGQIGACLTGAARDGLNFQQVASIWVALPPLSEQQAIARFLDKEVAKIDALVAEQRRLIALLAEKRQAVISHAVTKGLNPTAPLKPSGIDWLGDIPEGWEVVPLRRLIGFIEAGTSVNATDISAGPEERGVLKTSCVYSGTFAPEENKTVIPEEFDRVSCPLIAGTLIVSRMNTPDLVGAAGYVREAPDNLFLPDRLWQVHLTDSIPEFVHFWTMTEVYRGQVKVACAGTSSSMQNLTQDDFRSFRLAVPPPDEQQAIVAHLKSDLPRFDSLTTAATSAISLLQERRAALISAAVTGKIDLRPYFAQSLSEPETA